MATNPQRSKPIKPNPKPSVGKRSAAARKRPRPKLEAEQEVRPHRGETILALGALGLLIFGAGIAAWYLGHVDLKEMKAGRMDPEGRQSTRDGYILGIVGTVFNTVAMVFCISFFSHLMIQVSGMNM